MEDVSRELLFRVLVVAPGHEPTFFQKVDPLKGPLVAGLKARTTPQPPNRTLLGRVVDPDHHPVPRAVVSVETTVIGNTYYGSPPEGTDPLTVTGDNGEFSIQSPAKFDAMMLNVEVRGMARGIFKDLRPGPKPHELTVTEGVMLTGRVLWRGQPRKDVVMGTCGTDRSIGNFTGDFVTACQPDGRFSFLNLPPNREYFLYGRMDSLRELGASPLQRLKMGADGQCKDVGDLEITPGRRLAGRIELSDHKPLPPGTRLTICREDAWDTLALLLPADGRFDIPNLPGNETLSLGASLKGYRPSQRNASFESLNGSELTGVLREDKTDLVFLLEPGPVQRGTFENEPEEEQARHLPLGGVETKRVRAPGRVITGRAIDADTKQELPAFRVTPGEAFEFSQTGWIRWLAGRASEGSKGAFSVDLPKRLVSVVLEAEADGYLPARSAVLRAGETSCMFELTKGTGPTGVLLDASDQPLHGVSVVHLGLGEQIYLTSEGKLQDSNVIQSITDAQGMFHFRPKFGASELIAACPAGFARTPASEVKRMGKLKLSPWARIAGRLVQKGKPVANEHLDLEWAGGYVSQQPHLNLGGVVTDDEGRFSFARTPPGSLAVTTRQTLGEQRGWKRMIQRRYTASPGIDLDLGDVEMTRSGK